VATRVAGDESVRAELVERVRRRLADESTELGELLRDESDGIVDDVVFDAMRRDVEAELHGAGRLEPLLAAPGVTDVLVNGPDDVWLDRGRGMERAPVSFRDDLAVRRLAQRLAAGAGARLDDAMPYADAVLPDGTRVHAVLPPLVRHPTISLRVLARRPHDLDGLVARAAMPSAIADVLRAVVTARLAFVVTGGAGTGKTTLLGALLGTVPVTERVLLIEDAPELVVAHPHVVRLVTRGANVEGAGAVGQRELVRQALRMRPDRLVVGEFRGVEMVELLVALNTGHDGGAATLHANSAADVPARFTALGALAGLPAPAVTSLVASAIDVVVHLRRGRDARRVVSEIALLTRSGDELVVESAWSARDGEQSAGTRLHEMLRATEAPP
jgi:pilus assembly protein CpaF